LDPTLYLSLRYVHIIAMALWIGGVSFISGDARRTLKTPGADLGLLTSRMRHANRIAAPSALVTLATGFALIYLLGGFAAVPRAIHIGTLSGLIMLAVGGGVIGRTSAALEAGIEAGEDRAALIALVTRMTVGVAVFHALWMFTLAAMVFRGLI